VHTKARHLPLKCGISGDDDNSLTASRSIRVAEAGRLWGRGRAGGSSGEAKGKGEGDPGLKLT